MLRLTWWEAVRRSLCAPKTRRRPARVRRPRRSAVVAAHVQQLEPRLLLSAVTWTGNGDGTNWSNAANWSGAAVPQAGDDVTIAAPAGSVIRLTGTITVRSLNTSNDILVASGSTLRLTGGVSVVSGGLTLDGATLRVEGAGTEFTANGASASINGASLYAATGAKAILSSATSLTLQGEGRSILEARGAGSVLDLGNVTSLRNSTSIRADIVVTAAGGGTVDLGGVTEILDPTANPQGRSVQLYADGAGSVLDLSSLTAFRDASLEGVGPSQYDFDTYSTLSVTNGATLAAANLSTLNRISVTLDATSTLAVDQWESFSNGVLRVTGGTRRFESLTSAVLSRIEVSGSSTSFEIPALSNIDGASFIVTGGAVVRAPAATSFAQQGGAQSSFEARGAGSLLDLGNVTSLRNSTSIRADIVVKAVDGGTIDLGGVTEILDPVANPQGRSVQLYADGAGSFLDLSSLTAFRDASLEGVGPSQYDYDTYSILSAANGGTITVANSLLVERVAIEISATGIYNVGTLQLGTGALLYGNGTLAASVINGGTIDPTAAAGGLVINGNLTQLAGGTLRFDLTGSQPGTQFDQLHVTGQVTLGGTLQVVRPNGYVPALGAVLRVLDAGNPSGRFTAFSGFAPGSGLEFKPQVTALGVLLVTELTVNPFVVSASPSNIAAAPFSWVEVTFSEGILESSFTTADVVLTGPAGAVAVTGVVRLSDTRYRVVFAEQTALGEYTLTIGPNILDFAGNPMNQGGGGGSTDRFTTTIMLVDQTTPVPLALGETITGTLGATGSSRLYAINLSEPGSLAFFLDAAAGNQVELYIKRGSPPTRGSYDAASTLGNSHILAAPNGTPGTWYVLVYSRNVPVPGEFTLRAANTAVILTGVTPDRYSAGQMVEMTIKGTGFVAGMQASLVDAAGVERNATSVRIDSFGQMTVSFDLTGVPAARYSVKVTHPAGTSDTLPDAFTVGAMGVPRLETKLILPGAFGRHAIATIYVEYSNTGTGAMSAPILILQSADPDGSDRPLLTLDQSLLSEGFWTSAMPDGFSHSVQIYASGATPGLLQPGETVRVPIYYAGLLAPWDSGDNAVELEIRIHEAGDTTAIDWPALTESIRPDWVEESTWNIVAANLQTQIGPTWGDYVRTLNDNATYLGRLGVNVNDIGELYSFEVQQALGLNVLPILATSVDARIPSTGLSLEFGRSFGNTITKRHELGAFGYGWSVPWQTSLEVLPDGMVVISQSADSQRRFQPDSRSASRYFSSVGDAGTLRKISGGYELIESSGMITRFHTNGRLNYIQDTDGNRITATFTGGRLTGLVHSDGVALALTYNAAGRIASITDSAGRTTTYGYDPTYTHLLAVTGPGGTLLYTYSQGDGAAREHALTSVTLAGGSTQFFEYDTRGRLSSSYRGGNVGQVNYSYGSAGQVTVTDATGASVTNLFDHRGLVARREDSLGGFFRYEYNDSRQLIRETNALGDSRSYTWCSCGQGQGTLTPVPDEDLHQEVVAPSAKASLHHQALLPPMLLQKRQCEPVQPCDILPRPLAPMTQLVLAIGEIQAPVAAVLDPPVTPHRPRKPLHTHRQAADVVTHLARLLAVPHALQ